MPVTVGRTAAEAPGRLAVGCAAAFAPLRTGWRGANFGGAREGPAAALDELVGGLDMVMMV